MDEVTRRIPVGRFDKFVWYDISSQRLASAETSARCWLAQGSHRLTACPPDTTHAIPDAGAETHSETPTLAPSHSDARQISRNGSEEGSSRGTEFGASHWRVQSERTPAGIGSGGGGALGPGRWDQRMTGPSLLVSGLTQTTSPRKEPSTRPSRKPHLQLVSRLERCLGAASTTRVKRLQALQRLTAHRPRWPSSRIFPSR